MRFATLIRLATPVKKVSAKDERAFMLFARGPRKSAPSGNRGHESRESLPVDRAAERRKPATGAGRRPD